MTARDVRSPVGAARDQELRRRLRSDGHNNLMQGTPSFTGLKCQEISDEVPQLVGLKHQVWHRLVRRLKRHLQRHRGHARHVGDLCEGRRIRIPRAVLHSKDRVTRSACLRGDLESECWVAALLCGGGRHSKQDEKDSCARVTYRLRLWQLNAYHESNNCSHGRCDPHRLRVP